MKYTIVSILFVALTFQLEAKKKTPKAPAKVNGIHWMTFEQVQEQMKTTPKKVYIDIYTDWCGWCKVMDKKTFSNKDVINYMNENFYCIHFNAEQKDSVLFNGKKYGFIENSKTNELAGDLMRNQFSYPTSVLCDESFANPQPIPGYLDIPTMEMIVKYIGTNQHKTVPFEKYKKEFKGVW